MLTFLLRFLLGEIQRHVGKWGACPADLQWELAQQVPFGPLRCIFCPPTFHRDVGALRSTLNSVCIFTFSWIFFFFLFIFSELSLPRIFSAGKPMWQQNYLSNLDGQIDWICHKSNIVFFLKRKWWSFPRHIEFLGENIFIYTSNLFNTSAFPSHKQFQCNDFLAAEYVTLWRSKPSSLKEGIQKMLVGWKCGGYYSFLWLILIDEWMTCLLKWLFSSTGLHIYSRNRWNFLRSLCFITSKQDNI